jgi:hypothetical protein
VRYHPDHTVDLLPYSFAYDSDQLPSDVLATLVAKTLTAPHAFAIARTNSDDADALRDLLCQVHRLQRQHGEWLARARSAHSVANWAWGQACSATWSVSSPTGSRRWSQTLRVSHRAIQRPKTPLMLPIPLTTRPERQITVYYTITNRYREIVLEQ